jgi:hypothetical protein
MDELAPVRSTERISSIDTLRGFSLLGVALFRCCSHLVRALGRRASRGAVAPAAGCSAPMAPLPLGVCFKSPAFMSEGLAGVVVLWIALLKLLSYDRVCTARQSPSARRN